MDTLTDSQHLPVRLTLLLLLVGSTSAGAQVMAAPSDVPARQWASEAALNEIKVVEYGHNYLRYHLHSKDPKGDQVRDVIESKDGTVARLIQKDGRALTPEEDAGEHARLQAMIDQPDAYFKHVKSEGSSKKMATDLLRHFPASMVFTYAPGQPQQPGRAPDEPAEIVIDFKPDPAWTPPSMAGGALTGLEGRAWIDPRFHYMTHIDADIFRGISFGLGMLAHISQGGTLSFDQTRVSDKRWLFTRFVEHVNARVLLKNVKQDSNIEGTDISPVPEMGYQDAVRILMATPLLPKRPSRDATSDPVAPQTPPAEPPHSQPRPPSR